MIDFDLSQFSEGLKKKQAAVHAAVRPAAQLAAEHIYFEARLRCPVSAEAHYFYGKNSVKTGVRYLFQPGNLRDSIYQVYSKANSTDKRATYHISWNHIKAPYGFMVEYGTSRAPAHPFLRPAVLAASEMAAQIMRAEFLKQVNK